MTSENIGTSSRTTCSVEDKGDLRPEHAVFGAAQSRRLNIPWAVAFSILGHHAGLPSVSHAKDQIWDSTLDPIKVSEALAGRLDADREGGSWPDAVVEFFRDRRGLEATFDQELLIRMLFSCLVDADYLDTEAYMTGQERALRPYSRKSSSRAFTGMFSNSLEAVNRRP